MDAGEFVQIGGKIMEIGGQLEALRAEREDLNVRIAALEKDLLPLLARHSELVASLMGAAMPKPAVPAPLPPPVEPPGPSAGDEKVALARRIKGFLNDAEPGTSAMQIAEALKVDASLVREVMRTLSAG